MRRALILICTLTLFCFGTGTWMDRLQCRTAESYLSRLAEVRSLILDSQMEEAAQKQSFVHALWQHDEQWMNCLISHHHTRAVSEAMLHLATALEMRWTLEALEAVDDAWAALEEISESHVAKWSNVW